MLVFKDSFLVIEKKICKKKSVSIINDYDIVKQRNRIDFIEENV